MADTPKDLHLAIWELLTPEERPLSLRYKDGWWHDITVFLSQHIAHRAIVDAAREVLDNAYVRIFPVFNGWECKRRATTETAIRMCKAAGVTLTVRATSDWSKGGTP